MESMSSSKSSLGDRIMGILTYKAPIYREVADDTTATGQAVTIVIAMAVLTAILRGGIAAAQGSSGGSPIGAAIGALLSTLIGWVISALVLAWVSTTFFNGKTNTSEMLRVTGFVAIFDIVQIIPFIGPLIAGILKLVGYLIGIREAAEITTTQAVGVAIITFVVYLAVALLLTLCALPFFFAGAALSNPL